MQVQLDVVTVCMSAHDLICDRLSRIVGIAHRIAGFELSFDPQEFGYLEEDRGLDSVLITHLEVALERVDHRGEDTARAVSVDLVVDGQY